MSVSQLDAVDEAAEGEAVVDDEVDSPLTSSNVIPIIRQASILDHERDFIKLFVHQAGVSEVPQTFLEWGAVSLISACLAERSYQCFLGPHIPLFPNLYTFLLADSGVGKGVTCDLVGSFLQTAERKRLTGYEESRTTAQGTMDRMAGKAKKLSFIEALIAAKTKRDDDDDATNETAEERTERLADQHRVYMVFEELAASVGSGVRADDLVKFLTKSYGGKGYVDRTRTWGEIDFSGQISVNLLAGSTHRWLKDCVNLDAVLGGFFARVIIVDGDLEGHEKRVWRPIYPPDADLVREHLNRRVEELLRISGEFKLTAEADELGERWYMERPAPEDPALGPIFRREKATMLKLAHVFACASFDSNGCDYKIHSRHVLRAQHALRGMARGILRVVAHSAVTRETRGLMEIVEFITKNELVSQSSLAQYARSIGVGAEGLRNVITMLRDSGEIEITATTPRKYRISKQQSPSLSSVPEEEYEHELGGNEGGDNDSLVRPGVLSRSASDESELD